MCELKDTYMYVVYMIEVLLSFLFMFRGGTFLVRQEMDARRGKNGLEIGLLTC